MNIEVWKDIDGFESLYQVSSYGRIRSLPRYKTRGRVLKQCISKKGYLRTSIMGKPNTAYLIMHRVVAKAFIPNPNNLPEVNHKDGNKQNNHVDNLEWCTHEYNVKHSVENKLADYSKIAGSKNSQSKLNEIEVVKIRQMHKDGKNFTEIAKQYNVTANLIGMVCRMQNWKHV